MKYKISLLLVIIGTLNVCHLLSMDENKAGEEKSYYLNLWIQAVNKSDLAQKLKEEGKNEEEIAKVYLLHLSQAAKKNGPRQPRKGINPSTEKERINFPPICITRGPKY